MFCYPQCPPNFKCTYFWGSFGSRFFFFFWVLGFFWAFPTSMGSGDGRFMAAIWNRNRNHIIHNRLCIFDYFVNAMARSWHKGKHLNDGRYISLLNYLPSLLLVSSTLNSSMTTKKMSYIFISFMHIYLLIHGIHRFNWVFKNLKSGNKVGTRSYLRTSLATRCGWVWRVLRIPICMYVPIRHQTYLPYLTVITGSRMI